MRTGARLTAAVAGMWVAFGSCMPAAGALTESSSPVPGGSLGRIASISVPSGVAASAPTVTSSAPCDGRDADGKPNPDQDTIAVLLISPSLLATRPHGEAVQVVTSVYSRSSPMSVPFGQTFTDAYRLAGATIKGNERVEIRMVCQDALAMAGGTFEGSVTFNADATRYTADGIPAGTTPSAQAPMPAAQGPTAAGPARPAPGPATSASPDRRQSPTAAGPVPTVVPGTTPAGSSDSPGRGATQAPPVPAPTGNPQVVAEPSSRGSAGKVAGAAGSSGSTAGPGQVAPDAQVTATSARGLSWFASSWVWLLAPFALLGAAGGGFALARGRRRGKGAA